MKPRRWHTGVWVLAAALALIGGAAWALETWRCRSDLDAPEREMARGRSGAARAAGSPGPRCNINFGLGTSTSAHRIEVRSPSGRIDRFRDLAADAGYLLREGDSEPRSLAGFPSLLRR